MTFDWNAVSHLLLPVITLLTMVVGLLSLLTMIIPGLTIIWAAALVYGIITGMQGWDWFFLMGITILMIIGTTADNLLIGAQTRASGAPWWSVIAAMIGSIAGSILLPPLGGILAALILIFVIEFVRLRNWKQAYGSLKGMVTGCSLAALFRFTVGTVMIIVWSVWAFLIHKPVF